MPMNLGMRVGLRQEMSLTQILTPQMRMNLELIQAPILEAVETLDQEAVENPWLEKSEEAIDPRFVRDADRPVSKTAATPQEQKDFEEAEAWFDSPATPWTHEVFPADEAQGSIAINIPTPYEQLQTQAADLDVTRPVLEMVRVLLPNLNEHGYLPYSDDEIIDFFQFETDKQKETMREAIHALRYQIEPPGIGARDQSHCYLLQLERRGLAESLAARIVREGALFQIKPRNLASVAKKLGVKPNELNAALEDLRKLYAHPLSLMDQTTEPTRYPDLIVELIDDDWVVSLSHPLSGRYRFGATKVPRKKAMMKEDHGDEDPAKILERLRGMRANARMMVHATEYRDRTLYEIGKHLVKEQRAFLEKGEEALKPLLQKELAERLGMNEATISRILKEKYMLTPAGLIPMSAFFSRAITNQLGNKVSNKAVMDALSKLIEDDEDPEHPWSDQDLSVKLKDKGFPISRRTVTKYRQIRGIGAASDRKATRKLRDSI